MNGQTFKLESRYFIFLWFLPLFWLPGYEFLIEKLELYRTYSYWSHLLFYYYYYGILLVVAIFLTWYRGVAWRNFFKARLGFTAYIVGLKLTVFIFIFSLASVYWLFYPLSFLIPEFVSYWYINIPPSVYVNESAFPVLPNILSFVALVIIPPLLEEYIFRGVLLHRLSAKFGLKTGILLSSIMFGMIHPDPIGAVAFGIAMCILYLKFQSLWLPIACHAANNFLVWLLELYDILNKDELSYYTLEQFRAEWWIGAVCTLITFVWIAVYLRGKQDPGKWELPII